MSRPQTVRRQQRASVKRHQPELDAMADTYQTPTDLFVQWLREMSQPDTADEHQRTAQQPKEDHGNA